MEECEQEDFGGMGNENNRIIVVPVAKNNLFGLCDFHTQGDGRE